MRDMAQMERILYEFSENFDLNHLENLRRIFCFSRGAPFRFAWRTRRHEKLFLNRQPFAMFRSSRARKIFISRLRCCRARREKRPSRNQVSIWVGNGKVERKSHASIVSGFLSEKVKPIVFFEVMSVIAPLTCDGDVLHQVRCDFFVSRQSNFSDFFGVDELQADSWHPLRWKLMMRSHTEGGLALGGGRMYNICF